jgi:hypothetical protein
MRFCFGIIFFLLTSFAFDQKVENSGDSLIKLLNSMNLEDFSKKMVSQFISKLPSNYKVEMDVSKSFEYPYMAILSFPDKPYVEIRLYFQDLSFTNPNGISRKKKMRCLMREIVRQIEIYDEFQCVNGCD